MRNPFPVPPPATTAARHSQRRPLPQRHAHQGAGIQRPHHVGFLLQQARQHHAAAPVPVHPLTREALRLAPDRSLYRLGHSTGAAAARRLVADRSGVQRARLAGAVPGTEALSCPADFLAELPLRGVILSHDHYDHLDRRAIKALASKTEVFLSPLGVGDRLAAWCVGGPDPPVRLVARRRNRRPAPDGHAGPAFFRTQPRRQQSHVVVVLGDRGRRVARLLQRRQRLFRRLRRNRPALRSL